MKRILYLLVAVAFLGSCSTSKKTTTVSTPEPAPVPPAGITFTQVENYKDFKTIYMPYEGNGFGKDINAISRNDAGENIPKIRHNGYHVYLVSDLSDVNDIDYTGADVDVALEKLKKTMYLKFLLKKENIQQEYIDVTIAGKKVKKFQLIKPFNKGDNISLTMGYIIPYNNSTAMILLDGEGTTISGSELVTKQIEEAFEYMIETVEFREYDSI